MRTKLDRGGVRHAGDGQAGQAGQARIRKPMIANRGQIALNPDWGKGTEGEEVDEGKGGIMIA